jgi:hypothetical protein
MANYELTLTHHGIKGMRWGIRRTEAQLARARGKVEELEKKLEAKGGQPKSPSTNTSQATKSVKDMSYDELQQVVNRLNLEQRYSQLKPEKVSLGKRFMNSLGKDVILPAAREVAKEALKVVFKDATDKAIKKQIKKAAKS